MRKLIHMTVLALAMGALCLGPIASYAGCYCAHENIQFPAGCWTLAVPKCKTTSDTTSCFMNGGIVTVTVVCVVGEDTTIQMVDCNTDDGNYCPGDWGG